MSSSASLKALQHRAESQKERWCRQFAIEWRCWLLIAHHLASWRAQPQRGLQVWRVAKSVFRTGGCIARWKPRLMSAIPIVFPTYETIVSRKLQCSDCKIGKNSRRTPLLSNGQRQKSLRLDVANVATLHHPGKLNGTGRTGDGTKAADQDDSPQYGSFVTSQ